MKRTLVYTCIYNNLWGTDFGGRPGRDLHYKLSLLSIIRLDADKVICFTSQSEFEELNDWFFNQNSVDPSKFELKIFDLKKSKYYDKIQNLKNLEEIKKSDRCFEIQYNKFFWLELIDNLDEYPKVYWFDAGLSHGGLFPIEYSYGVGYSSHFSFDIFSRKFLDKLNDLTDNEKFLVVGKNNTGRFYWSSTIPSHYYDKYDNSIHIIGGFFGGNTTTFKKIKKKFDELLTKLLDNESNLYYEELIMSCLFQNKKEDFILLDFDDWYDRKIENYTEIETKYFFHIFEEILSPKTCVVTSCIEIDQFSTRYVESCKNLIFSYLKYTRFDILVLTNKPEHFNQINSKRVIIKSYNDIYDENILSSGRFNMHIKRLPISIASDMPYDLIYYHDCDCYIVGWDSKNFNEKCSEDFDVAFVSHANPQLGSLRKNYKHFEEKILNEFGDLYYEELDSSPNPAETRVIFKNNLKLKEFLNFWDKISNRNKDFFTYHDGVYFGTSAVHSKMKMIGITHFDNFSKFCRIKHGDNILDYFGNVIKVDELIPDSVNQNEDFEIKGFSQIGQDVIALKWLKFKKNGVFLDIGCGEPKNINNTYLLEKNYDWSGMCIDIEEKCDPDGKTWSDLRPNSIHLIQNAININYENLLDEYNFPLEIDFLSLDLEPPDLTLKCLFKIPFDKYKFKVITFETDEYRDGGVERRELSRNFLNFMGYRLVQSIGQQEDIYVHKTLIDK